MRFDIRRIDDKPIKIKQSVNKSMVIGTILFIACLMVLLTSKNWLPDDRKIMNLNTDNVITFNKKMVELKDVFVDREKLIAEAYLSVTQKEVMDDLKFGLKVDGLTDYPQDSFIVIKGTVLPVPDTEDFQQEILIQFAVPEEFYYISLYIEQDGVKKEEIQFDYRKMEETTLSDKSENYLISFDDVNEKIIKSESIIAELEKAVEGYTKNIETLERENLTLETKIKGMTDEKTIEEKKKVIEINKQSLEESKKNLEDSKGKLENEKRTLEDLQAEKAKQR